jgi:hypothetical protein
MLCLAVLAALSFSLLPPSGAENPLLHDYSTPTKGLRVFLLGKMSEEARISLSVAVAASPLGGLVLVDSPTMSPYLAEFLRASQPDEVIPVGSFAEERVALERRMNVTCKDIVPWDEDMPPTLGEGLFPHANKVVVCPSQPRAQLLQAACLAGTLQAPLWILPTTGDDRVTQQSIDNLSKQLTRWQTRQLTLVGQAKNLVVTEHRLRRQTLANEAAVAREHRKVLASQGAIETLVAANPFDSDRGGQAAFAPWMCVQKQAPLLLTNAAGTNVNSLVEEASRLPELNHLDAVLIVANLKAIPVEQRPNPIPADKDQVIDMEPLTPTGTHPFSFSVGRLFHDDPAGLPLLMARQRLLRRAPHGPRRVLIASNVGGSMPLLETFSRHTALEFRNNGYETTAFYGKDVEGPELRRLMPQQDIFLWEGHHNALIRDWHYPSWDEPLPPSLVFLQSCLALKDYKVQPVLGRGAIGVVGTSTRTYSASGGACSLAFFDALLYENQTLGGSLRQAKNFLLAYTLLKEKRLGTQLRSGANLRAAWAFTLWGDPTLRLPPPPLPEQYRPAIRHEVRGDTLILAMPNDQQERVVTRKGEEAGYQAQMPANGRLAGLIRKDRRDEDGTPLVPFVFAEVHLPQCPQGYQPVLHGRLPASRYVFCWDERRRCGYLLATPRPEDQDELRFHIDWQPVPTGAGTIH